MGWKKFKERFGIKHIVQIADGRITIGSGYISDLASVHIASGKVFHKQGWESSLKEYAALWAASPEEIKALLDEPDQFEKSTPVYIVSDATVLEEQCEEFGYPNITHSGRLMYENTSFLSREKADNYALCALTYRIDAWSQRREKLLAEVAEIEAEIAASKVQKSEIETRLGSARARPNKEEN